MATYKLDDRAYDGMSHFVSVDKTGVGVVELSNEETEQLIKLIVEQRTLDVEEMKPEEHLPEINAKLFSAYNEAAVLAALCYFMMEDLKNGNTNYDSSVVMAYCKKNLYYIKPTMKEYRKYPIDKYGDDFEKHENDDYDSFISDHFSIWFRDYIYSLELEPRYDFPAYHLGLDVDDFYDDVRFNILIPEEIKEILRKRIKQ